jgi:hypothetical protein
MNTCHGCTVPEEACNYECWGCETAEHRVPRSLCTDCRDDKANCKLTDKPVRQSKTAAEYSPACAGSKPEKKKKKRVAVIVTDTRMLELRAAAAESEKEESTPPAEEVDSDEEEVDSDEEVIDLPSTPPESMEDRVAAAIAAVQRPTADPNWKTAQPEGRRCTNKYCTVAQEEQRFKIKEQNGRGGTGLGELTKECVECTLATNWRTRKLRAAKKARGASQPRRDLVAEAVARLPAEPPRRIGQTNQVEELKKQVEKLTKRVEGLVEEITKRVEERTKQVEELEFNEDCDA